MLAYDKILWLHAEITTKCNAHCPACARNNNGFGLREGLILTDLLPERFEEILNMLPNLQTVQLCGTYGDPVAAEYIDQIIDLILQHELEIRVHTNGSLKTKKWWNQLALKLEYTKHSVIFGIDGLEKVHEIYRQGTNFNKIIENAKSFINAGGHAEWQFLLFEHNKHQVKDCIRLSQQLGFKKFIPMKSIRIPTPAYNYKTGKPYEIKVENSFYEKFNNQIKTVTSEDCMHLNLPSIYVNANGSLTPCCYLRDWPYDSNNIDLEIPSGNANKTCQSLCGKFTLAHKN